ncbi:hypothetical protein [Nocardioides sp. Kera G14]|uniref:hypothetical protein n=1 Tax=Nocardioides sp. Kera G14 TaxID=2884264 RepID=UPI001D116752|nr:hypothetical protein [Nocardioides sp. Kera G14]UDY25035.1 hypothetical protein LH076_07015 [Nocardioides sp. Kera G14]
MPLLPERASRSSAAHVEVFDYNSYVIDDCLYREWRLWATGISGDAPLEGWYPKSANGEHVIGRIRVKRCEEGQDHHDGLSELFTDGRNIPWATEILNLELEPAFLGQRLGMLLVRAAIAHLPPHEIVLCEPKANEFDNVPAARRTAAVDAFYRGIGLAPDVRLPGYLLAQRADLIL